MQSTPSLPRLLEALQHGDEAAQHQVLLRYQPWLRLLARMQIGAKFQGKFSESDIVQEALLQACRDLPRFRGGTEVELLAWLRQVLAHVLAHQIRRYHGTQQRDISKEISLEEALIRSSLCLQQMLVSTGPSPSSQAAKHEQELKLADVMARLPDDHREVIVLRNLEGLSHAEVAARMGRSVGAVRMLWIRALAQLKSAMSAE
jgi:RNA polymerase sigma-70 factor (ECF subfamily)